ncbi:MAG TPA: porin [Polyangiaceae bacterium]|nr:porin [Polyangiaceae bacterium]
MLSLRCSTAAVVLVWASALHAQQAPAPAPAPGTADTATFPPIEPLPQQPAAEEPAALAPAAEAPKEEKPAAPDRLSVGKNGGFFQPSALIQLWGQVSHLDTQKTTTGFRLRRVELRAKGDIVPKTVSYYAGFDVAKVFSVSNGTSSVGVTAADGTPGGTATVPTTTIGADRSPLQDVWITYSTEYADVVAGQFKIPIGLESQQSSARLFFPERNKVDREYGDRRDIGIKIEKKIADVFYYYVGIFNGNGQNTADNDRAKDLGLRLEAYPIPGLLIGGAAYGTVGAGPKDTVRNRVEGDLRLELADLIVQGSYIHAWTGPDARRLEGQGVYGQLGYTIANTIQPVARLGYLDINRGDDIPPRNEPESGPQRQFEIGLNYLVKGHDAKITGGLSYYSQENGKDLTEFTIQTQAVF